MSTLQYSSELLDDILFRAGEPTDGTSDFQDEALRCLNRAYRAVWTGGGEFVKGMNEPWLWLKADPPGTLTLQPVDDTGSISVTNNSTSATLSATRASSVAGWFLQVDGSPDVFRVSAHTAGTAALTLDSVYTGDDDTAASFKLMKLEYTLASDLLLLMSPMRCYDNDETRIEGIDMMTLDRDYPLRFIESGTPEKFALVTTTKVRFNRYGGIDSTDYRRVDYDYLAQPADLTDSASEEPLVPLQFRHVLADIGLFYLFTTKGDSRAEAVGLQAKGGLNSMAADNRARAAQIGGGQSGKLQPRQANLRRKLLRTDSGLIIG